MAGIQRMTYSYTALPKDTEVGEESEKVESRLHRKILPIAISAIALLVVIVLLIAPYFGGLSPHHSNLPCSSPSIRREWRTLATADQEAYITAVQCLTEKPSDLMDNGTLYDDLAWTHAQTGVAAHGSALFFTWHRYFLHVFETRLRSSCEYSGPMPYWDWTQDWEDLAQSPIFSPSTGFGGNGAPNSSVVVGHGRCVVDGPFVQHRPQCIGGVRVPHCLSRGFADDGVLYRPRLSPEHIDELMEALDYDAFNLGMEERPHNVIPESIRGDFYMSTAPNDPVFYLHHAQLDRIWWLWQRRHDGANLWSYGGWRANGVRSAASLEDVIDTAGLAPEVQVRDVMRTDTSLLCYAYE